MTLFISLFAVTARSFQPRATALGVQGTVFVGTLTCTLDDSFVHRQTNAAGQTNETTFTEHASTLFVLAQGKPIIGTGTYASRETTKSTDPQQDSVDTTARTEQGSFSGPLAQPDDFGGFDTGRPTQLQVYTLQIPVTFTYSQSHSDHGQVLTENDPPRTQGTVSYPDRNTALPILTVTENRPTFSGGVSNNVSDSQTNSVDGHDGCTWSLTVVIFNGKPLRGGVSSGDTAVTPTAINTAPRSATRTLTTTATPIGTSTPQAKRPVCNLPAAQTRVASVHATMPAEAQNARATANVSAANGLGLDWAVPPRVASTMLVTSDHPLKGVHIDPVRWQVMLIATKNGKTMCDRTFRYRGTLDGTPVPQEGCRVNSWVARLGKHTVTLTITSDDGPVGTVCAPLDPQDLLLVGLGDSVASGEGNPDQPADSLRSQPPTWQSLQCHRSATSYQARAAAAVERAAQPHSSVTFVYLACSGATLLHGLLSSFGGIEPRRGPLLPPQIDRMVQFAGSRQITAVLISVGANDSHFSDLATSCGIQLPHTRYCADMPDPQAPGLAYAQSVPLALTQLKDNLARLSQATGRHCTRSGLSGRVSGPDALRSGAVLPQILTMDQQDVQWTFDHLLAPLNRLLLNQSLTHLDAIGGIQQGFVSHGYCARASWIVPVGPNILQQILPTGGFHPNEQGHVFMGQEVAAVLSRGLLSR